MTEVEYNFFKAFDALHRLKISSMLPGIPHAEYGTLHTIEHAANEKNGEVVTVSEIVKRLQVAPPAVSRCLKSLEEKNYIIRKTDKADRRNTSLELTKEGRLVLDEADNIMRGFCKAVIGEMGEENVKALSGYLEKFRETCETEIAKRQYKDRKGDNNAKNI